MANHLSQLGVLARLFFVSLLAVRICLFVVAPSTVIALSGKVFDYGTWEPFFVWGSSAIAGGTIVVYIMIVIIMFPAQLISVVSSRQYGLLPYIRHYLTALIVCVLLFLQVVAYCILVFGLKSDHVTHYSLIVAIMLILGLIVMLSFTRLGPFQFFYFFTLPVLSFYLGPQLNLMADPTLVAILGGLWVAFLTWWFNWHPKKYHKSLIGISTADLNKQDSFFWGRAKFFGAVPHSLESGVLFGKFGSSFYQTRMLIIGLPLAAFIPVLIHIFFSYNVKNTLMPVIKIAIAIQIIPVGFNYSLILFKNINKFWLYFSLERIQLFNTIERNVAVFYLKNLTAITLIISTLSFFILDDFLRLKDIALLVLASLLVTATTLYTVLIAYVKWRGSVKAFHWVNAITMTFLFCLCFLGLEFFAHNELTNYLGYLLTIIMTCSIFIVLMRQYAKRLWQRVDLVRVAV
ncbi:MAG: hypothetical protein EOO52_05620 [Gammaproteobacteria bacterium]|nr:MAG: hypothetical protein EOO52_05620 [Gammaproteobacteria bacterium]